MFLLSERPLRVPYERLINVAQSLEVLLGSEVSCIQE